MNECKRKYSMDDFANLCAAVSSNLYIVKAAA